MRFLVLLSCISCSGQTFSSMDGGGVDAAPSDGMVSAEAEAGMPAAIRIVQATQISITQNVDPSVSFQVAPMPGNAIVVGITCFSDIDNCVIPPGGVTDNQGNVYQRAMEGDSIISSNTHGSRPYLFIAENILSNGTLTITVNPNGMPPANYQNFAWGAIEVAGLATMSIDRTGMTPSACCDPMTTVATAGPTTIANELAVAVHSARSNDGQFAYTYDPSWTQHHVNNNGISAASQHSMVSKVLTATGVASHTWGHNMPSRGTSAIIVTFKGRQ